MLVFISDLHLTDGTTCTTIGKNALNYFVGDLEWMVRQACRRGSGREARLDRVDLVLLGDIVDLLRSARWSDAPPFDGRPLRPWTPEMSEPGQKDAAHAALAGFITELTRAAVEHNSDPNSPRSPDDRRVRGLDSLRQLAASGVKLRDDDPSSAIPVNIWYVAGNHDWFYNVARREYDEARRLLIDAMGLKNKKGSPFPHTMEELPDELAKLMADHRVFAQHGDIFDKDNFQVNLPESESDKRRWHSSLGDAIVIGLINALEEELIHNLAGDPILDNKLFGQALKEIDNVRPLLAIPQWLSGLLLRFGAGDPDDVQARRRGLVLEVVRARLGALLAEPFVRRLDRAWEFDLVDILEIGKLVADHSSLERLARASEWAEGRKRVAHGLPPYQKHAVEQLAAMKSSVRYVVLGHTHHPEVVPLDLDQQNGWVYINTGTWRPVHIRCVASELGSREFLSAHVMTWAAIYKDDERGGRPYETWTGMLGLGPEDLSPADEGPRAS